MGHKECIVETSDGFELSASVFPSTKTKNWLLIASGTGIPQQFYFTFARYLNSKGFTVVTFDYRGIGNSRPRSLRNFNATMNQWAKHDLEALIQHCVSQSNCGSLSFVGHSVAGQLLGLTPSSKVLDKAVFIASQEGYWKLWPWKQRFVFLPLFGPFLWVFGSLLGYMPCSWVGMGEDLPKGVAVQWARWCKTENYLFAYLDDLGPGLYTELSMPLLSISFDDDFFAPKLAVDSLLARYQQTELTSLHYEASDFGRSKLGHFSFFKNAGTSDSWERVVEFLT